MQAIHYKSSATPNAYIYSWFIGFVKPFILGVASGLFVAILRRWAWERCWAGRGVLITCFRSYTMWESWVVFLSNLLEKEVAA